MTICLQTPGGPSLGSSQSRDEPQRVLPIDVAHVRCGQIKAELRKLLGDPRARAAGREICAEQDVVARHQLEQRCNRACVRGAGGIVVEPLHFVDGALRHLVFEITRGAVDAAGEERRGAARMRPDEPNIGIFGRLPAPHQAHDGARRIGAVFHDARRYAGD